MMKVALLVLPLVSIVTGCVSTTYQKDVWVTKDAAGNVTSRVEHEAVLQPLSAMPMRPEYIKGM